MKITITFEPHGGFYLCKPAMGVSINYKWNVEIGIPFIAFQFEWGK